MANSLSSGLPVENSNKRALENGQHCSVSSKTLNFKARKVSADRDFPPNCGQDDGQVIPEPHLSVAGTVGEQCEVQSSEVMGSPVRVHSNENMVAPHFDSVGVVSMVRTGEIEVVTQSCTGRESNEFTMHADVECQGLMNALIWKDIPVIEKADGRETSAETEIQSDKVLENPTEIEADTSLDNIVGKDVAEFLDGMGNEVEEEILDIKPVSIVPLKDLERKSFELLEEPNQKEIEEPNQKEAQSPVKRLENVDFLATSVNGPTVDWEVLLKDEAVPSPNDKFRRRRVSANRDFPPSCGRNVYPLAEDECLTVSSDPESLTVQKGQEEVIAGAGETKGSIEDGDFEPCGKNLSLPCTVSSDVRVEVKKEGVVSAEQEQDTGLRELVEAVDTLASNDFHTSEHNEGYVIVNALMAAPHCPWRRGKMGSNSIAVKTEGRTKKREAIWLKKARVVAKKTTMKVDLSERSSLDMVPFSEEGGMGLPAVEDGEEHGEHGGPSQNLSFDSTHDIVVALPPYGPNSSRGDARNKVRETLRLFQTICRKILQGEEAKTKPKARRLDLEAIKIMKAKGKDVGGKEYLGVVPGVEVGDEFQFRVELAIVGIHRLYQAGIDYMNQNGMLVAISIVSSGAYADDMEDTDSLIYCGQGGHKAVKGKEVEDQKLERGNLALRNSIIAKNPVRVIHGFKEAKVSDLVDSKSKTVTTYVYDGLYTVENYWQEEGKRGKQVFLFKLKRIPGQPELAMKEVKKSNKLKVRHGICETDIAGGKELIPICAVNAFDSEKPPAFSYIAKMMYADLTNLLPPQGCDCTGRCADSLKCSCACKNGGEIPYNHNGAIVEAKPLVYECGPSCKCPPYCYNRVTQNGIKLPLEIFKTETRGWGVRSLTFIPSGTFICEYVGELLEDKEAEKRKNDEYLFDIGQNYSDCSLDPDGQRSSTESSEEVGYTIDAAYYGNVGRFINHSCSPNLYAQNVLYDHSDKKMPHIMLFAAENIPAMKELTYHYNYSLDQVHDSDGNIKMKSCYCGSSDCVGRLY